jgi:beta-glucosidase
MPSGEPEEPGSIPPDAVVAAWLPGSEGQGVADVLFGDYKPTGELSFTWPKAVGKGTADPLFAYGYGL